MPAPARTSLESIVAAARGVLADDGLDGLTMQRVALATGVRAPSLYKHVASRADLIRLVTVDIAGEIRATVEEPATDAPPAEALRAMAIALRAFAHHDPHAFSLLFAPAPEASGVDPAVYAAAAAPIIAAAGALAGDEHALDAARTLTAWASGFLRMELAGAFRLGGSVDQAFEYGVDAIIAGVGSHRSARGS